MTGDSREAGWRGQAGAASGTNGGCACAACAAGARTGALCAAGLDRQLPRIAATIVRRAAEAWHL